MSLLSHAVVNELCQRPAARSRRSTLHQTCHINICKIIIVIAMKGTICSMIVVNNSKNVLLMIYASQGNYQCMAKLKFKNTLLRKISRALKVLPYCLAKSIINLFLHRLLDILCKLPENCQHCLF